MIHHYIFPISNLKLFFKTQIKIYNKSLIGRVHRRQSKKKMLKKL